MLITISRQYAAGSSEVAGVVADALGWRTVDNAFVEEVARRAGVSPEEVARLDERAPSFLERLARSTSMQFPELFVPAAGTIDVFEETKLLKITRGLVKELASEGRSVLVGRAAAAVLEGNPGALHVRLVASRAFRLRQAIERLGIPADDAGDRLHEIDGNRKRYHHEYYERDWDDATLYDMVLNTERLGFEGAADVIVARARGLGW